MPFLRNEFLEIFEDFLFCNLRNTFLYFQNEKKKIKALERNVFFSFILGIFKEEDVMKLIGLLGLLIN